MQQNAFIIMRISIDKRAKSPLDFWIRTTMDMFPLLLLLSKMSQLCFSK